jgi:hypothetical protein
MRKLTIGFSRPKDKAFPILSWLIRLFEGTPFSHVYVKNETRYGIDLIYQASGVQVNFVNCDLFHQNHKTVREFELMVTDEAFDKYMHFALKNVGKPYSLLQVVGIFLYSVFPIKDNPFRNGDSAYVCSELVSEILYEAGKFNHDKRAFDKLTPKHVYEYCLKNFEKVAV